MGERDLLQVRKDIWAAKRALRKLQREEHALVLRVPCPLCRAEAGAGCRKPGGGPRDPHKERHERA